MAIVGVGELVAALRPGGLLEPTQVEEVSEQLAPSLSDPRKLAAELIRRDWLTPYQANQLLQGKGRELSLGPYVLIQRLGEGGMGQVFKARHQTLDRIVALKILHPKLLDNDKAVRRFLREVRAAAQLSHPNIVHAFDAQQIDGRFYFAMEYIQGTDLAQLVKRQGPLKVAQACDYIRQAALGLQHAFECGMVHRDIKPANLLVTQAGAGGNGTAAVGRWGQIKILDMGLARVVREEGKGHSTELTQLGAVMGTPDFIAPEQARDSHNIDIRADLYSLGCTLYFLLTGLPPFPVGTITERLLHHQFDEPEPVDEVRRRELVKRGVSPQELKYLSSRVTGIVRRLMSKKPEDRYQTPAELAQGLHALLQQSSSAALHRPVELLRQRSALPLKTPPPVPTSRLQLALSQAIDLNGEGAVADTLPCIEPAAGDGQPIILLTGGDSRPTSWLRRCIQVALLGAALGGCLLLGKLLWGF